MPRDGSGVYTLAPGNPVVAGTLIQADWANPTLTDVAAALTDSLSRSGNGGMLVPFRNTDGAVGAPGMTWNNEPTSGWYRAGLNDFWYSVGNENIFRITKLGVELAPGKTFTGGGTASLFPSGSAAAPSVAIGSANQGIFSPAAGQISISAAGAEQLRVNGVASAVNFLSVAGAAAADYPKIIAAGADANIGLILDTKGNGAYQFRTGSAGVNTQFVIAHTAGAVNCWQVTGSAVGVGLSMLATGADANINGYFSAKGAAGELRFFTNSLANEQLRIIPVNSINFWGMQGGAAGQPVTVSAIGADANISMNYLAKGAASHLFYAGGFPILVLQGVAAAANYMLLSNAAAGNRIALLMQGTDANVGLTIAPKGNGAVVIDTGVLGGTELLHLANTGGAGAGLKFTGTNPTPNKWIRCVNGNLEVINSAYSASILQITDAGALAVGSVAPVTGFTSNGSMTLPTGSGIRSRSAYSAWVRHNAAGTIIRAFNVDSVTKNGVGLFTVNITPGIMADGAYGFVLTCSSGTGPTAALSFQDGLAVPTATSFSYGMTSTAGSAVDPIGSNFVGFLP